MRHSINKYIITILLGLIFIPQLTLGQAGTLSDETFRDKTNQDAQFIDASGIQAVHPSVIVAAVIRATLTFLAVIFISLIIYAGFRWMTSTGNEESISKAKKIMTAAIIGVVLIILAFAITQFVLDIVLEGRSSYYNF